MNHLTPEQLSALLDRALSDAERESAERHVAECATCRDALAVLAAQDRALGPLLEHDPPDAYFESFAARVEDRIRAAGLKGAQAREDDRWLGWLRSPRRLAWVGAVAVVAVGAGVVMLTTRIEPPELRKLGATQSLRQTAPSGSEVGSEPEAARDERFAAPPSAGTPAPLPTSSEAAKRQMADLAAPVPEDLANGTRAIEATTPDFKEGELRKDVGASTTRLTPSRRTTAGEDVPVRGQAAAPGAPAAASAPAEEKVIVKPSAVPADRAGVTAPSRELVVREATGQPQATVCGRVLDTSRNPVSRARVTLVENGRSVATDAQGRFCIGAVPGDHTLSVMAIGFQETRLSARAGSGQPGLAVTLQAVSVLDDQTSLAARGGRTSSMYNFIGGEPNDVFSALPDSTRARVREAQAITADGQARPSADRLEEGAQRWGQVLSRLPSEAMRAEASYRLAEARVSAWRLDAQGTPKLDAKTEGFPAPPPGSSRRDVAVAAVRGALTTPVSRAQEQTLQTWLKELAPPAYR